MKKICLSIDQMRQLKELGVETKDASIVLMFFTDEGEELSWDQVEDHGKEKPLWEWFNEETEIWEPTIVELFDAETGDYDHSYREECGVFTLQDMLDLMPNTIDEDSNLNIYFHEDGVSIFYENSYERQHPFFSNSNILDAAFDMLVWLAEHGYLKGGGK